MQKYFTKQKLVDGAFGGLFALIASPFLLFVYEEWVITVFLSGLLGGSCSFYRRKSLNKIKAQIDAPDSTDLEVTYASARYQVYTDYRVYLAQAMNSIRVLSRIADFFFLGMPALAFWFMIGAAIYSPDTFNSIISIITSPADMLSTVASFKVLFKGLFIVYLMVFGFFMALGFIRFGYINCFEDAIARKFDADRRAVG